MKKVLLTVFVSFIAIITKAQLSPNFYNQFKAILHSSWEDVKGDFIKEEKNASFYTSKKQLDGFQSNAVMDVGFKFLESGRKSNTANVQLFDEIKTELLKLKNEDYSFRENKSGDGSFSDTKQSISVGKNGKFIVDVSLFNDNHIEILFLLKSKDTGKTNNVAPTSGKSTSSNSKTTNPTTFVDKRTQKIGFKDPNGNIITPAKYDKVYANNFSEGMQEVRIGDGKKIKYGFVDSIGKEAIAVQYDEIRLFSEGLAPVKSNEKWGFIDKAGKVIIPFQFIDAYGFKEGLAQVKIKDVFGYIDKTGTLVIPYQFTQTFGFKEGLAAVNIKGKWGYIDKNGIIIIPLQYDYESSFYDGKAKVKFNGKEFYIDKTGKEVK